MLDQHLRRHLRRRLYKLEDGILADSLVLVRKGHQGLEAGIRLPQHRMSVSRHDLPGVQQRPEESLDIGVRGLALERVLHLEDKAQDFLGGEAVEGTREALEAGGVGEEGVGEGGADEVGCVCRDVSTFMVAVEGEVEAEEVDEAGVVGLAEHSRKVLGPVFVQVDGGEGTTLAVGLDVDFGGDGGEFGEERDGVVKDGLPVLRLVELAGFVEFGKDGVVVEGGDGDGD